MANPIVHFEFQAKDAPAQAKFYSELFSWEVGAADAALMNYQMIHTSKEAGAVTGGLMPSPTGTPDVMVYVHVDNLQATLDHAQQLGATTLSEPHELPGGGHFAVLRDPEGNQLGLISE